MTSDSQACPSSSVTPYPERTCNDLSVVTQSQPGSGWLILVARPARSDVWGAGQGQWQGTSRLYAQSQRVTVHEPDDVRERDDGGEEGTPFVVVRTPEAAAIA